MTPAQSLIINSIKKNGVIAFDEFMHLALYAPEVGYYMKESTRIGRAGDYYTSPSLQNFFAVLMGMQIEEMWEILGQPEDFVLLEIGPGMGYFARDILDYLKHRPIYASMLYVLVELNPHLLKSQQRFLEGYRTEWIQSLHGIKPFKGVIFSNELLDSFPVCLVEVKEGRPVEIGLSEEIVETAMPCRDEVIDYIREFFPDMFTTDTYDEGYRTEINLWIRRWLRECAAILSEGFIISVDYGYSASEYYAPERNRGTLLCYHRHSVNEDPLINIGEQDITAHVNFSSVKRWGEGYGLQTCGFASQGMFLVSLDIEGAIRYLYGDKPDQFGIARLKSLLLPHGLGESHKVIVQYKGDKNPILRGFQMSNRKRVL